MTSAAGTAGALIGHRMGKYELVALLALGGTAEIYLARIGGVAGFEKYVVVKCLHDHLADDSEFVRMFLDEARLTAQLDHSNIVQTIELGEHEGRYYIVMEYLAGMSLSLVARRAMERVPGGRMPVDLTLCLCAQACAGLHYAHQRTDMAGRPLNIVHRDVSPQNLVVSFEGIVKLVDFGIAKAEMRDTATRSGTVKGKFAYMSPEQCTAGQVDHRTDVFAMGVVVHELLTGRRLFKRPSTYDTYRAIVEGKVPAPSQVHHQLDPALDEVVMKALAHERDDRYPTAEAFGEALARALHRRGQAVSAGLVASFFEQYFSKEMREHAERMRALISGRQAVIDEQWDQPDMISDVHPEPALDQAGLTVDMIPRARPDIGHLGTVEASLSEIEGDATRVEMNPLLDHGERPMVREPEARRRSGILPLPPDPEAAVADIPVDPDEPETLLGGSLKASALRTPSSGIMRKDTLMPSPVDVVGRAGRPATPPPSARLAPADAGVAETLAMQTLDGEGQVPEVVPAAPRLPGAGAAPRGRATAPAAFGNDKTAPAGPLGLRNRPEDAPEDLDGIGDDVTPPDAMAGHTAPSDQDIRALDPSASPLERPVLGMDHPLSAPMSRSVSSQMERMGSGPISRMPGMRPPGVDSARVAKQRQAGLPMWLVVVLFLISVGVGLGATLLIDRMFF
jgi:serine/threonine protein kinase